uniref:Uncharacterized protein n=1 Tax=Timema poppense TaxID=170557 RepID=A0A7R9H0Z1_TIMPO|nr:unnamed protein product [Timema poppensis]
MTITRVLINEKEPDSVVTLSRMSHIAEDREIKFPISPTNPVHSTSLWIGCITETTTEEMLRDLFSNHWEPIMLVVEGYRGYKFTHDEGMKHKSKVDAVGMGNLRNVCGKTHMDRVSNEWVLKIRSLKGNPKGQCEISVLRWFGLVETMSVDQGVKQIYEGRCRKYTRIRKELEKVSEDGLSTDLFFERYAQFLPRPQGNSMIIMVPSPFPQKSFTHPMLGTTALNGVIEIMSVN